MTSLVLTAPAWPWIAAATLVMAALLALLEWKRVGPHRPLRTSLIAVAVLALGAIGVRPARSRPIHDASSIVLVVSVGNSSARRPPPDAVAMADSLGVALVLRDTIPDLAWLRRRHPGLDTLYVSGPGLGAADLGAAEGLTLRLRATRQMGLTQLAWTRAVALGEPVTAAGRIIAASPGTWARLDGPGGVADSVLIDSIGGFTLRSLPRAAGRQLYVVRTDAEGGTAAVAETLGVMVAPSRLPRVLVLESAPSFETRYLKNWLGENGGEVAVRSLLGRGAYRYEFLNRREVPLARITSATLAGFDVVVIDGRALAALSTVERTALEGAVADSGRGLLLLADELVLGGSGSLPDRDFFVAAPAQRLAGPDVRDARVPWATRPVRAANWSLRRPFATRSLAESSDGIDVVRMAPRGTGHVAVTLLREPGRWLLAGEATAFGEYWTRLLTPLAAGVRRARWEVAGAGPIAVDAPVDLMLVDGDSTLTITVTGPDGVPDSVHASADPLEPDRRRLIWWPRESGWHRVEGGGAALEFHAASSGSSAGLAQARRIAATRRGAVWSGAGRAVVEPAAATTGAASVVRPLSSLPFFVLLVAALGALWIAAGPRARGRVTGARPPAPAAPPPAR